MKKIFSVGLSALSVCLLVGCGGGGGTTGGPSGGTELDLSAFPAYVDPDKAAYGFGFKEMVTPYFKGNVIYNETVMLVDSDGVISGNLQYKPVKILSVRDYTWEKEYPASEYTVSGNTITMKPGGSLPYLEEENLQGKNIPEPYREVTQIQNVLTDWMMMGGTIYTESPLIYGNQISVSYVYDVRDLKPEEFADYETSGFPKLKAKLNAGEDVKIVIIGDSVAEGCSSSKHFNHEPNMDNWADQVTQALDEHYEGKVTSKNVAVGGTQSSWGASAAQVNSVVANEPDMVIIHFGINDVGGKATPGAYQDNIEQLVTSVQACLPDCEFMLVKALAPNPISYGDKDLTNMWKRLDRVAENCENTYTLDMYTMSKTMLGVKKYMDITGNGINHVNDFTSRLYTMNILSALIKY